MTTRSPDPDENERLKSEIARIKTLGLDELRAQWRNVFAKRAPKTLSRSLLIRILAYRVQADALGDLDVRILRVLDGYGARDKRVRQGERKNERSDARSSSRPHIKPGSVLVRECAGRVHRVMALDAGFAWEGGMYRSLSEVARAITGTRWNGRRFFGVDRQKEAPPANGPPAKSRRARSVGGVEP